MYIKYNTGLKMFIFLNQTETKNRKFLYTFSQSEAKPKGIYSTFF